MLLLSAAIAASGSEHPAGAPRVRVEAVGSMQWARSFHHGTALADGRVLVTGGSCVDRVAPIPWCEVFDPAAGRFEATGALNVPRHGHVAVLLDDGDVLVAGGWRAGYSEPTATAEVWDSATEQFAPAGSMTVPRGAGTAVARLADGRVLLIGGVLEGEYGTATDAIDVFDPVSRSFARWGSLTMARTDALAHVLEDGRVLVAGGGFRCCSHPASEMRTISQEILDPVTRRATRMEDVPHGGRVRGEYTVQQRGYPTLVAPVGLAPLLHDGTWYRPSPALVSLFSKHGALAWLSADLVLAGELELTVLDLSKVSAAPLEGLAWSIPPAVTPLAGGGVLVTGGGGPARRPRASAWVVSAR